MGGWEHGRVGSMGGWEHGRVGAWEGGSMEGGSMGGWEHGRVGAWEGGSWEGGSMGGWEHGGGCMGGCIGVHGVSKSTDNMYTLKLALTLNYLTLITLTLIYPN